MPLSKTRWGSRQVNIVVLIVFMFILLMGGMAAGVVYVAQTRQSDSEQRAQTTWLSQRDGCRRANARTAKQNETGRVLRKFLQAAAHARAANYKDSGLKEDRLAQLSYQHLITQVRPSPIVDCVKAYPAPKGVDPGLDSGEIPDQPTIGNTADTGGS